MNFFDLVQKPLNNLNVRIDNLSGLITGISPNLVNISDASGYLKESGVSGQITLDWFAQSLNASGSPVLNWGLQIMYGYEDGENSIDWSNRLLGDTNGNTAIDWSNRQLTDSSNNKALTWDNGGLWSPDGDTSIDWHNRIGYDDNGGLTSFNWNNRYLYAVNGSTIVLNWGLTTLSGSWKVGNLTGGYYDIVNYNNLTGTSGFLQAEINIVSGIAVTAAGGGISSGMFTGLSGLLQGEINTVSAAEAIDAANITTLQGQTGTWATQAYVTGASGALQTEITTVSGLLPANIDGTNGYLLDFFHSEIVSIDWFNRFAYDSSSVQSILWQARFLMDSAGNHSVGWDSHKLFDSNGNTRVNWQSGLIWDNSGVRSLDSQGRNLDSGWLTTEPIVLSGISTLRTVSGASGALQAQITSQAANLTNLNALSGTWATIVYVTGISGVLQTQITTISNAEATDAANITALQGQTGNWATHAYVTGISGVLQTEITTISNAEATDAANIATLQGQTGTWATQAYVTGASGVLQAEINIVSGLAVGGGVTLAQLTGASGVLQTEITLTNTNLNTVSGKLGHTVGFTLDGGGSALTGTFIGYFFAPFAGTINNWYMVADASGTCAVDVWKSNGTFAPTVANTIVGSQIPALTGQQFVKGASITGWSTAVSAGDLFGFNLNSSATIQKLTFTISYI